MSGKYGNLLTVFPHRSALNAYCAVDKEEERTRTVVPRRMHLAAWAAAAASITSGSQAKAKQGGIPKFKGLGKITNEYVADVVDCRNNCLYYNNVKAEVIQHSKK